MQNKKIASIAAVTVAGIVAVVMSLNGLQSGSDITYVEVDGELPPFTVDDLSKGAKYVVIGKVISITPTDKVSEEASKTSPIYSDVVIGVQRDLTNQFQDKQISVRIMGGQIGNTVVQAEHTPEFTIGEDVLVFVADKAPHTVWGDNYYVAGLELGKYRLANGNAFGIEHPDGINEEAFISKIQNARIAKIGIIP